MDTYKVGDRVRYIGRGRFWRDTMCEIVDTHRRTSGVVRYKIERVSDPSPRLFVSAHELEPWDEPSTTYTYLAAHTAESNTPEEHNMSIKIEHLTLINGQDIKDMSVEKIANIIRKLEDEQRGLEALSRKPKPVRERIAQIGKDLDALDKVFEDNGGK